MPAGRYLYRLLRDDENPSQGLTARDPNATDVRVSSHINGKKMSPFISTTATKQAVEGFYWLAVKRYQKQNNTDEEKEFTLVKIDKDKLVKTDESVEIIDLTDEDVRIKDLGKNTKVYNYARKYEEVLIKGFIPPECISVTDFEAMSDSQSQSSGLEENDYADLELELESVSEGTQDLQLE